MIGPGTGGWINLTARKFGSFMQEKCLYIIWLTSEKTKDTGEDRRTYSWKFNIGNNEFLLTEFILLNVS